MMPLIICTGCETKDQKIRSLAAKLGHSRKIVTELLDVLIEIEYGFSSDWKSVRERFVKEGICLETKRKGELWSMRILS